MTRKEKIKLLNNIASGKNCEAIAGTRLWIAENGRYESEGLRLNEAEYKQYQKNNPFLLNILVVRQSDTVTIHFR